MSSLRTAVGVCAYNEESNIRRLLSNLITEQNLPRTCNIFVICSGCTDGTEDVVREFQARDERIKPIIEDTRKGKANALNKIFEAVKSFDTLVLVNADALPAPDSINKLVSKLHIDGVGAVFAQPVPFHGGFGVCLKIVRVIWLLHHLISLKDSKLSGELCALRTSCVPLIPENIATDEPYIELAVRRQGYKILYLPDALVHIRCPTNILDLTRQRKRIWLGHMQLEKETGFKVSTSSIDNVLRTISNLKPSEIIFLALGAVLEAFAFSQARIESRKGKVPYIWEPIKSTKTSIRVVV